MKNLGIFSLLLLLLFSSCRKDTNGVTTITDIPNPTIEDYNPPLENIVGNVTGFIIDEAGEPVKNASVSMNGTVTSTDDYGHFFMTDETMNALGTLVKIEKDGYFDGSRRFFPNANENNRVKIQLLTKSFDDSFNTVDGGTVEMNNGASVDFAANSIRTEAGVVYNGVVNVATKWMDPSQLATLDQMPGNLQGLNSQVEAMALATYGMIAVELEGANGEALNIATDKTATISMPVPSSMLSEAPAEIPLWSYNEEHGLWVEESSATLQNGAYVGEVSHFSFWNCDVPFDFVNLDLTLVDDNGDPLNNYIVTLTAGASTGAPTSSGGGITDDNGNVSGAIPANEVLILEVYGLCGEVLYTQEVGPYDTDATETITASASMINATTISGTLIDCDNNPVTNGVVKVSYDGGAFYHYPTTADFTITFTSCESISDLTVTGIDVDNLEQGTEVTAPANAETDLGDLSACGNPVTDGIAITVDGVTKTYIGATVTNDPAGNTYIEVIFTPGANDYIGFGFGGTTAGDYASSNYVELISDSTMGWLLGSPNQTAFSSFDVAQYDTQIVGTASGVLIDELNNQYNVSISFTLTL